MNDPDLGARKLVQSRALWIALLVACTMPADAVQHLTVGNLLRKEELAMMEDRRSRQPRSGHPVFELIAIWGVAPALSARVRYRGGDVEFRQGRRAALEPHTKRFKLTEIKPPCILFSFQGDQRKVCLPAEIQP